MAVMADGQRAEDGRIVVVTPCDCRAEVTLSRAQVRLPRWQTCPSCERRWRLYVLGSGRVLWADIGGDTAAVRPRRWISRMRGWRR